MKQAQMSSMDLVLSFSIVMAVIAISLVFIIRGLSAAASQAEIDEQLAYRNLLEGLKKNSTINFLEQSKINLTAFHEFGIIAENNLTRFTNFFAAGNNKPPEICLFLMNSTHHYVNVSGSRYAYGMVSDNPAYGTVPLETCQSVMDDGISPCAYYPDTQVYKKAVYLNMTYLDLYIIYCKT